MAEELCRANYLAYQMAGKVVIIAFGSHETSGYEVRFQDTPIAIFPPEYSFVHTAPSGPVEEVETEFLVSTTFPSSEPVETIRVHDAEGMHEIGVVQSSDPMVVCRLPGKPTTPPPRR